jgi:hypothetical protein
VGMTTSMFTESRRMGMYVCEGFWLEYKMCLFGGVDRQWENDTSDYVVLWLL